MKTIFVLNGPNLNMLGKREPGIYGTKTLDDIGNDCRDAAGPLGLQVDFRQSNHEGVLIDAIHEARKNAAGIIINPAGLTFYAVSLLNALEAFDGVKIEVHLTNRAKRADYYHRSLVSYTATGMIEGLGGDGYVLAVEAMALKLAGKA